MAKKDPADFMTPFVFPASKVMYSNLQTPDRYETDGGVREDYRVQILVEETPEWEEALAKLQAFQDERMEANDKDPTPLSCIKRRTNKETGQKERFIKFKSKDRERFQIVDAHNRPYAEEPWGGSIVKVYGQPMFYPGFGGGITLYIEKVMVVENAKDAGRSSGGGSSNHTDPFADASPAGTDDIPF